MSRSERYSWPIPTLTLTNISEDLLRRLRERAALHASAVEQEAVRILERVEPPPTGFTPERLEAIRALQARMTNCWLTDDDLDRAINQGRP